jgi:sigma-B regulation protein RsbU (phosphoserine phosphatase)
MDNRKIKVGFFQSLRTQLWLGTLLLMALTVSATSYLLVVNDKKKLTDDLEKTVVLQGRNIALSSQKALLHADPEIELYPLVTRILEDQPSVMSVTVTDANGVVQGDPQIANVGKPYRLVLTGHRPVVSSVGKSLRDEEELLVNDDSYVFKTPVVSRDNAIGYVHLTYSKQELRDSIAGALRITISVSAAALFLGLILALFFFQRISRPMQAMMEGVATLAGGNLDAKIRMPGRNEFGVLANAFNEMAFRIAAAQQEHIVKERMDRELEIARDIQHTLLPEDVHAPKGYQIAYHYDSATEVGGDYLDVIPAGGSRVGLVMADVSGKGVPGLVVMAMVKVMVQNLIAKGTQPKDIVRKLNSALLGNIRRNMFVTFFVALLDSDTGEVVFSNAGHNPVLIYNGSGARAKLYKMDGPPMGSFPDHVFSGHLQEYRIAMAPGDLLLQYTDGLNESMNDHGERFRFDRILELANEHGGEGAESLIGQLVRAEAAFRGSAPQSDDLTLLAVSVDGNYELRPRGDRAASVAGADRNDTEVTRNVAADH